MKSLPMHLTNCGALVLVALMFCRLAIPGYGERSSEWQDEFRSDLTTSLQDRFPGIDDEIASYVDFQMGLLGLFSAVMENEEYYDMITEEILRESSSFTESRMQTWSPDELAQHPHFLDRLTEAARMTAEHMQDLTPEEYRAQIADMKEHLALRKDEIQKLLVQELQRESEVKLDPMLLPDHLMNFLSFLDDLEPSCPAHTNATDAVLDAYVYSMICTEGERVLGYVQREASSIRFAGFFLRPFHENAPSPEDFDRQAREHIRKGMEGLSRFPLEIALLNAYSPSLYLCLGMENTPVTFGVSSVDRPGLLAWKRPLRNVRLEMGEIENSGSVSSN